jgi:proteasome lid subunit RPN8/RPN11
VNAEASPLRFRIDPDEQLELHNRIEEAGLELGAIYHSHTRTEPRPSQTDINFAKLWPGVLWIIVGLAGGEADVRTWRIDDGKVSDAELVVE